MCPDPQARAVPPVPQSPVSGLLWEAGPWLMGGCPRVWGASGHPPPPHEVVREVQGLEQDQGHNSDGGQSPGSPVAPGTFPTGAWPAQGPLADSRGGKGVRLQVWAPPEGDPTGALPLGSSLGRRERSCHALGEPNTVLVSGKWSTTSSEAQAGRGEGAALI